MCRNIQQLRGAEPPASDAELRDAALQYVRKISGYRQPSVANREVFEQAVDEIAAATRRLLDGLVVGEGSKPADLVQRRRRGGGLRPAGDPPPGPGDSDARLVREVE